MRSCGTSFRSKGWVYVEGETIRVEWLEVNADRKNCVWGIRARRFKTRQQKQIRKRKEEMTEDSELWHGRLNLYRNVYAKWRNPESD